MSHRPTQDPWRGQRGVALVIVLIVLTLCGIAALSSTHLGWLNEKLVGAESDRQRAQAAAEALIRDAENDIKGWRTGASQPCPQPAAFAGCRDFDAGHPFFPQDAAELELLQARLPPGPPGCLRGICLPAATDTMSLEDMSTHFTAMTAGEGVTSVAARYGEFTGLDAESAGNPLLRWSEVPRAWYWVEVFWYDIAGDIVASSPHGLTPDQRHPFVYRITAHVQGMKPGTRVWLRSVYVPRPHDAPELQ